MPSLESSRRKVRKAKEGRIRIEKKTQDGTPAGGPPVSPLRVSVSIF
jgi:hypothetical protein